MNKLSSSDRALILRLLVEGNSIRATTRIADVSKNTVTKLIEDAGKACAAYHDLHVRGVTAKHVQADEIWAFCYAKARNVPADRVRALVATATEGAQLGLIGEPRINVLKLNLALDAQVPVGSR